MTGVLENISKLYNDTIDRHRNRPFLEATMAACAMVAMADGSVSLRERVKVDEVLETLEALQVFDPHEGVNLFNEFADAINENPKKGREKALAAIVNETTQHRDSAYLMIKICVAVSKFRGEIPLVEQIEIVSLCSRLVVEPHESGLYSQDGVSHIT